MRTFSRTIKRVGAKSAPILLLTLIICLSSVSRADAVRDMLTRSEQGLRIRGGIHFDMLPEEVESVERENGLHDSQIPRAFTLSWNRLEYSAEGASLVYRFESLDGLRLQEILWSETTGDQGDAKFDEWRSALCDALGAQPMQKKLPCSTKNLRAFDERLFMKQGAYVIALSQWLIHVDEGDAAVDLYLCRSVNGEIQLRLGIMLLSDPESAENRAALTNP